MPLFAYGLDAMISGPDVVARPGRTALRISVSVLLLNSSLYQNAASSAMTVMYVGRRRRRKLLERTSMVMPLLSRSASAVRESITGAVRFFGDGNDGHFRLRKRHAFCPLLGDGPGEHCGPCSRNGTDQREG